MQHASDTNRKDRAQRKARRKKFNENRSDVNNPDMNDSIQLDFSHLTEEEIGEERKRIQILYVKRRKRNIILVILSFSLVILGIALLYSKTSGFEYW